MIPAEHLLDTMPCGYVVFDDRGNIGYANKTFLEMTGYAAAEMEGASIEKVLTISSRIFYQTHLFPLLRMKGAVSEIFVTLKSNDGTQLPVMLNGKRDEGPEGTKNIFVLSTVWERQKYEQELIASRQVFQKALEDNQELKDLAERLHSEQRELDRKIVDLSRRKQEYMQLGKVLMHDMQEPVRKIGFYFDKVLSEQWPGKDSRNGDMLAKISKSVTRLRQLTTAVQRFVASENDDEHVVLLTSNKVVSNAAKDFKTRTGIDDFTLEVDGAITFEGKPALLASLFYELISNAVRFRSKDVPLIIRVRSVLVQENVFQGTADRYQYTDHIQIEFSDNGVGFAPAFATYIFGLFNKLENSGDGIGLGLALCEQIVSRHYGKISARSAVGEGATFIVQLPVLQPKLAI